MPRWDFLLLSVRIRQAINVESGLNDGIALPVVLIVASLASVSTDYEQHDWLKFLAFQLGFGPLSGIVVGFVGARFINIATAKKWMTDSAEGIIALAIAVLAYALAESLQGNGFISAFVAGMIFGNSLTYTCRFLFEFAETEGQIFTLGTFFIFGAVLIPVILSLLGTKINLLTALFLGWFGPRGFWHPFCFYCWF